jgi:hypothetical protein
VGKHGENAIARIDDLKVAGPMELIREAKAIGVEAGRRWLGKALEDLLDQVGLDMKMLA